MDMKDKKDAIKQYCDSRAFCEASELDAEPCPLTSKYGDCPMDCYVSDQKEVIDEYYEMLFASTVAEEEVPDQPVNDVIKHPNHYCRDGAMECIDEMVLMFGKEVVKNFCLCNIWKYRYRSADKNGKEDIEKSDRYVQIYKELCNV